MDKKTKKGLIGILVTTGLTLLCGLAYALNEKLDKLNIDDDDYDF